MPTSSAPGLFSSSSTSSSFIFSHSLLFFSLRLFHLSKPQSFLRTVAQPVAGYLYPSDKNCYVQSRIEGLHFIFSQVVWKKTKKIGAAQQTRRDERLVVVIRYSPAGNYVTEKAFRENVLPARSGSGIGQVHSCSALTAFLVAFGAILKFLF